MKLILSAIEPGLTKSWKEFCGDLDFVEIYQGSILDLNCDAVVSPANSFGFMDGGIDLLYLHYFGMELQMHVRRQIYEHHNGELLVGNADIVETGNSQIPFLIAAPTMRVPMRLVNSINPYLAARGIFILLTQGIFSSGTYKGTRIADKVKTIAIPGLGTGVGRVSFKTCALQVRKAIDDILLKKYNMPQSWAEASENHQLLYTDTPIRLQY